MNSLGEIFKFKNWNFKKIFKYFFVGLASLVALVLLAVLSLTLFIYERPLGAWHFAQDHFMPKDLKVGWQDMHLSLHKIDWHHWQVDWNSSGLHIEKSDPRLRVPTERVSASVILSLFSPGFSFKFREVNLYAHETLEFWQPKSEPAPKQDEKEQNYFEQVQSLFGSLDLANKPIVERLEVHIDRVLFHPLEGSALVGALSMDKDPAPDGITHIVLRASSGDSLRASLDANFFLSRWGQSQPVLEGKLDFSQPKTSIQSSLAFTNSGDLIDLKMQPVISYQKMKIHPDLHLVANKDRAKLDLAATATGIPGPVPKISDLKLAVDMPFEANKSWAAAATTYSLSLPLNFFLIDEKMRKGVEKSCHCRVSTALSALVEGKAWLDVLMRSPQKLETLADAKIHLSSVKNKIFMLDLGLNLKLLKKQEQLSYEPILDSEIEIYSYQQVRRMLDSKNILIPAPLNVLEGNVHFTAKGPVGITPVSGKASKLNAQALLDIDLASKSQRVLIHTDALVKSATDFKEVDLDLKSRVDQLQLELPPLEPLAGMPKVARDARILMEKPPKPTTGGTKVLVNFMVETPKRGAIRLYSKLADPYLPVTLKLVQQGKSDLGGKITIEPFEVKYLRRSLHVQSLTLDLSQTEDGETPLSGDFYVQQTEYKIMFHLGGSIKSPNIEMHSEPYLDNANIISVLLYDRTNDQLVSGDAETAGSVQAAFADRAIGIFGLWAFATTPIKSFSYNAVTKVYSATFSLGGGLTAGVGTDWEQNASLELRKRLSQRWVITASWSPTSNQRDVGKVVLEWEKRF